MRISCTRILRDEHKAEGRDLNPGADHVPHALPCRHHIGASGAAFYLAHQLVSFLLGETFERTVTASRSETCMIDRPMVCTEVEQECVV